MASSIPGKSHTFVEIDNEPILQSFSSLPLIHSIRAVVICAQSTNRFFKLAQEKRSALGVEHFIIFLMNRLYKTRVCSFLYCRFPLFLKDPFSILSIFPCKFEITCHQLLIRTRSSRQSLSSGFVTRLCSN